jgi:DMSO/TMAO reductase YedYZ molybdopterin-dependent catalytic subunit
VTTRRVNLFAGLNGLATALVTLGVAEVVALVVAAGSSPLLVVGSFVIDIVPPWVKDAVIQLFGTADKVVLLGTLGVLVLALSVAIGILEYHRPRFGVSALILVGVAAAIAAVTRADASLLWGLPTVIGVALGAIVLSRATRRLHSWTDAAFAGETAREAGQKSRGAEQKAAVNRRGFFTFVGAASGAALIAGLAARTVNAGTAAVTAIREKLKLPAPTSAAPAIPAGASLDIPGISPLVTSAKDFYRIDTALQVPAIDASKWTLKITGMVEKEIEITFDELLKLPMTERTITLQCVSNEVGGDLVGNATWLGYPIRELLARAKPSAEADMVLSSSSDGFTAGTPLSVLLDEKRDSLLAVGMNGKPLPLEHGFPARMVVPGLYGYVSATKWVVEMKVTTFAKDMGYWTPRGWDALGPIKISSRIDVPAYTAQIPAGPTKVAGVAWAQHTGLKAMEVRFDRGEWQPAILADAISADTWRQWYYDWDATKGVHLIECRATDANGLVQSGTHQAPAPNGSEGWETITVEVK